MENMRQKKAYNTKQNVKYLEKLMVRLLLLSPRVSLYFGDFYPSTFHFSHWETSQLSSTFFISLQVLFFLHLQLAKECPD